VTRITGDAPAGTRRRRGIKRDSGSGAGSAVRRTACCPAPVPDTPLGHLLPYLGYGAHGVFDAQGVPRREWRSLENPRQVTSLSRPGRRRVAASAAGPTRTPPWAALPPLAAGGAALPGWHTSELPVRRRGRLGRLLASLSLRAAARYTAVTLIETLANCQCQWVRRASESAGRHHGGRRPGPAESPVPELAAADPGRDLLGRRSGRRGLKIAMALEVGDTDSDGHLKSLQSSLLSVPTQDRVGLGTAHGGCGPAGAEAHYGAEVPGPARHRGLP
jgi:hypothetical protein